MNLFGVCDLVFAAHADDMLDLRVGQIRNLRLQLLDQTVFSFQFLLEVLLLIVGWRAIGRADDVLAEELRAAALGKR